MRLLRLKIPLAITEVFDFSETLMSFMEGFPVYEVWWDENGPTPRQQRRERILDSIAEAIGALQYQQEVSDLDEPEIGGNGPYNVVDEVANLAAFNGDGAGVVHFMN